MSDHLLSSPEEIPSESSSVPSLQGHSRRSFLGRLGALAAGSVAASGLTSPAAARVAGRPVIESDAQGLLARRRERAYKMRMMSATQIRKAPLAPRIDNGDEARYPSRIGSHTKCLPHNDLGEVDPAAYNALLKALETGSQKDFFAVPMGGTLRFHSPLAAFSYSFQGDDIWQASMPSAPTFASAEIAGEMAECYWIALARDVPFAEYEGNATIAQAAADLSHFSDFRGPKEGGSVTPGTLFRTRFGGVVTGPYISQFLLRPLNAGLNHVSQQCLFPVAGSDAVKDYATWLCLQRGNVMAPKPAFETQPRHIRCLRDMAEWVHGDYPALSATHAALILSSLGPDFVFEGNPYRSMGTDMGFATFGPGDLFTLINEAANAGVLAAWYQKWLIHRHLRPEEYAGRLHVKLINGVDSPLHPEILTSQALEQTFASQGTYMLSQSYPEGCPPHSAYPSGHATFVGASITILKALFREDAVLPDPVVPSADGSTLLPYSGPPLTVGGELNKLASNVAMGRIAAGVHWRSDGVEGMLLGERMAISYLRDRRQCYKEVFPGFRFTSLDGSPVTI